MSYMQDFEKELRDKLSDWLNDEETTIEQGADTFIRFVTDKVLESYKNGLKAGGGNQRKYPDSRKLPRKD